MSDKEIKKTKSTKAPKAPVETPVNEPENTFVPRTAAEVRAEVEENARKYAAEHNKAKKKSLASVHKKSPFFAWVVRIFSLAMASVTFCTWCTCTVFVKINTNISSDQKYLTTTQTTLAKQESDLLKTREEFHARYTSLAIEQYCQDNNITSYNDFATQVMQETYGKVVDKVEYDGSKLKNFLEAEGYGDSLAYGDLQSSIVDKDTAMTMNLDTYAKLKMYNLLDVSKSYDETRADILGKDMGIEIDQTKYELAQLKTFMDAGEYKYRMKYAKFVDAVMAKDFGSDMTESQFAASLVAASNVSQETTNLKKFLDSDKKAYGYENSYAVVVANAFTKAYGKELTKADYDAKLKIVNSSFPAPAQELKDYLDKNGLGYNLSYEQLQVKGFEAQYKKVTKSETAPNQAQFEAGVKSIVANEKFTTYLAGYGLNLKTANYQGLVDKVFEKSIGKTYTAEEYQDATKAIRRKKVSKDDLAAIQTYLKDAQLKATDSYDSLAEKTFVAYFGESMDKATYDAYVVSIAATANIKEDASKLDKYMDDNDFAATMTYTAFVDSVVAKVYGEELSEGTYATYVSSLSTYATSASELKSYLEEKGYSATLSYEGFKAALSAELFDRPVNGEAGFNKAVELFDSNNRITQEALKFKAELERLAALHDDKNYEASYKEYLKAKYGYSGRLTKEQDAKLTREWRKFQELLVFDLESTGVAETFMKLVDAENSPVGEEYASFKGLEGTAKELATELFNVLVSEIKNYNALVKDFASQKATVDELAGKNKWLEKRGLDLNVEELVSTSKTLDTLLAQYANKENNPEDLTLLGGILDVIDEKLAALHGANDQVDEFAAQQEKLSNRQNAIKTIHRIFLWIWVCLEAIAIFSAAMLMTLSEDLGGKKAINLLVGILLFFALAMMLILALHLAIM